MAATVARDEELHELSIQGRHFVPLLPPGVTAPGAAPMQGQARPCQHALVSSAIRVGCVMCATDGKSRGGCELHFNISPW